MLSCDLVTRVLTYQVILMSATMESEVFADYFSVKVARQSLPTPIVMVEGKMFPVTEYYLDDLKHLGPVGPCFLLLAFLLAPISNL